jgi:hypothetical protein
MLTYRELAVLGYCPATKYGYMKPLPEGWEFPKECPHDVFIQLPLQIQIFYSTTNRYGVHTLND